MERDLTFKQAEKLYKRLVRAERRLSYAISRAIAAGLIQYDTGKWETESPSSALGDVQARILKTTEKKLARVLRVKLRNEVPL